MKTITRIKARNILAVILSVITLITLAGFAAGAVNAAGAKQATDYGTVDWSTAAEGYITFAAYGQDRVLALQGPGSRLTTLAVSDGETAKIPLEDGQGRYQYAICYDSGGGSAYRVDYKDSFVVSEISTNPAT